MNDYFAIFKFINHFLLEYKNEATQIGFVLAFVIPIVFIYPLTKAIQNYILKRSKPKFHNFLKVIHFPIRLFITKTFIYFFINVVAAYFDIKLSSYIGKTQSLLGFAICIMALWNLVALVENSIMLHGKDATLAQITGNLLKIILAFVLLLGILQYSGVSLSGLLAFGGMGGLVVGMASKDMLANIFGSIMIFLDKPFKVGDWVRSPDREIEGMVEKIGLRITCIRNFDNRPLYVPNAVFANIIVENPARMKFRRIIETIGIRHEDADKMELIINDIQKYLNENQHIIDSDKPSAHFDSFGASSLNILLNAYCLQTNKIEFQKIKQQILLEIIKIIHSHGAKCAQPVSNVNLQAQSHIKENSDYAKSN